MSLQILHSWEVIKFESADQYQAHSCIGLLENKPQIKAPRVTPLEGVSTYTLRGIGVRGVENPQGFGIDERRFVNFNIQHFSEVYPVNCLIKSPQRAQSSAIPVTTYEKAAPSRLRTRMTRIARIFTDPWELNKLESADQYQSHSCLGLLKNKPQINADERRLIKSDEETCFLNRISISANQG